MRLKVIVPAFTAEIESDLAVPVDQVDMRPGVVEVSRPRRHLVVDGYWVREPIPLYCRLDVVEVLRERDLRRVNADDVEPRLVVARIEFANQRQRTDAGDAAVGPEIDPHDVAAKLLERQG